MCFTSKCLKYTHFCLIDTHIAFVNIEHSTFCQLLSKRILFWISKTKIFFSGWPTLSLIKLCYINIISPSHYHLISKKYFDDVIVFLMNNYWHQKHFEQIHYQNSRKQLHQIIIQDRRKWTFVLRHFVPPWGTFWIGGIDTIWNQKIRQENLSQLIKILNYTKSLCIIFVPN